MTPATRAQPATATIQVSSHDALETPSDRRWISAAAINPPANGSQARARREKNADPIASCRLSHKHHASDRLATI
jgi:hypothetical protein